MNQSQSLFRLIQSLSPSETRYITIAVKTHRYAKAYLKLFKEMNRQRVYDEQKLKERVKNEPFVKHFAVIKNHLFQFILKELRSYHESSSLEFKLRELLLDAAILNKKALQRESWNKLQQARQMALKFEDWKIMLEILYKEFMLIPIVQPAAQQERELMRISKELQQFVSYLNNYEEMAYCNIVLTAIIKGNEPNRILKSPAATKLMLSPVLKNENTAITLRARIVYFYIWSTYLFHSCEYEKAEQYLSKQVKLFEKNRHFIEWLPGIYMLALRDLVVCHYLHGRYPEALKVIQHLKQLSEDDRIKKVSARRYRLLIFSWTFKYEVGIAVKSESLQDKGKHIREREQLFVNQARLFEPTARLNTLLVLASFYFFEGDHKKSAKCIQKILSDPSVVTHQPVAMLSIILQILIHFEEQNSDSIYYLLKAMKRFSDKNKEISKTEKILIQFADHLPLILLNKSKKSSLKQYLASFNSLKENNTEKHHYSFFDVTIWLQHYLSKK